MVEINTSFLPHNFISQKFGVVWLNFSVQGSWNLNQGVAWPRFWSGGCKEESTSKHIQLMKLLSAVGLKTLFPCWLWSRAYLSPWRILLRGLLHLQRSWLLLMLQSLWLSFCPLLPVIFFKKTLFFSNTFRFTRKLRGYMSLVCPQLIVESLTRMI